MRRKTSLVGEGARSLSTLLDRCSVTAAPEMESDQREHAVEKGETLKVKIPFSGTGPFSFKLKKGNRELPDSDRVKLIPFEDYVILQIKGNKRQFPLPYCNTTVYTVHVWKSFEPMPSSSIQLSRLVKLCIITP